MLVLPVTANDHHVMKTSKNISSPGQGIAARRASKICVAAVLAVLVSLGWHLTISRAQPADNDEAGATVLTRGPVHEAFAGMVTFNPEPGVVVTKAPPEVIEELPPEERPEGDNVTWIPGYWAWDDERTDYLWVSGTWRALPPGRAWMAGYWGRTPQGYQWISGYWADAAAKETTYLPAPPATIEVGPSVEAPSDDYGWSPGYWVWYHGRYAWSPGYWVLGRADWDWCPGHYVWTPRGYIFVNGFWDYPVERRGILFAPVYFESSVYARRGYIYSPTIVIGLGVFSDHLFLRPSYCHYYFGDYYAPSYVSVGFYASFSFSSSRYGYDPIFSHQRWEHRRDREWWNHAQASYNDRRDHEGSRPPRTWAAQRTVNSDTAESRPNRTQVAMPIDQLAKRTDGPMKFQPVAKAERQQLARRGQEVQQSREQRRTLETKTSDATPRKPGAVLEPASVPVSRSPIVGKTASQLGRNQAPPKAQASPKLDTNPARSVTKPEASGRQPGVNRNNSQSESRPAAPEAKPVPRQNEAIPRERPVQSEKPSRAKETQPNIQTETPVDAVERAQPESKKRVKEPTVPTPKNPEAQSEVRKPVAPAPEARPAPRQSQVTPNERQVQPPARQPRQDVNEKGAGRLLRNDRPQNQPAPRNSPPAAQPGRENPGASDRSQPNTPDKEREKKGKE